jgi:hypothetical protein
VVSSCRLPESDDMAGRSLAIQRAGSWIALRSGTGRNRDHIVYARLSSVSFVVAESCGLNSLSIVDCRLPIDAITDGQ